MRLYLIRHGEAEVSSASGGDDERALTAAGAKEMRRVGRRLAELGASFDVIATSPLLRARQTAEALHAGGAAPPAEEEPFLAGAGDFDDLRAWIGRQRRRRAAAAAVVGHQPMLGEWAELLLCGDVRGRIQLKKGAVVVLDLPDAGELPGGARLVWAAPPKLLT
jgi:phosphohistidine phosphatase